MKWDGMIQKALHRPIVSAETFNAVQTMMESRVRGAGTHDTHPRLDIGEVAAIG
jgi:hypothetical protein